MSSGDVLERIAAKAFEIRRGESELLTLSVEAERDGAAIQFGSLSKLLADVGRFGLAEARRLAERACALHERAGLSGTPIPATLPNTAAGYAEGAVSGEHVDKIRGLAAELPADVLAGEAWPIAEHALAEYAREVAPRGLTRPIREMQARLDPDGQRPDERELAQPRRELRLTRRKHHYELAGVVDTETGLKLEALLEALGTPRSHTANGGRSDARTTTERHGDALAEAIQLATTSGELPSSGGEPFTILLTAPESCLEPGHSESDSSESDSTESDSTESDSSEPNHSEVGYSAGAAMDGTRIPASQLQRIACDATVVTRDGRHKRTAPPALRRALIARDQGCAHPDCDAPASRTQAHHIQHHANDGPTTLANMALLCGYHHRLVHHTGWKVALRNGRAQFTAPYYRKAPAAA